MHHLRGNAIPAGHAIPWVTLMKFCVAKGVRSIKPNFKIICIENFAHVP